MLHNEARKLLIEAWNKTHTAKEVAECFGVNTSTGLPFGKKDARDRHGRNQGIPLRAQVCPEPERPAEYRPDDIGTTR